MTRRAFGCLLGAGAYLRAVERPNVILITGDHLRWNHISANGNPAIRTPNMDRLVERGTTFLQCQTVGVACAPNRASMLTGRYPNAHGIISNGAQVPETEVTLMHQLRDAGYYNGQMGKLHFLPHARRNHREVHPPYAFHQMRISDEPGCYDDDYGRWLDAQGPEVRRRARVVLPAQRTQFDYYTFEGDERTTHAHWVASESVRFIEENAKQPFFLNAGFYAPHPPLNPPASMLSLYENVTLPPRIRAQDESQRLPELFQKAMARGAARKESEWTAYRKHFYAMVSEMDRQVGRMMDAVDKAGLRERTVFVLTSDHGDYLGDHDMNGKSDLPFEGSMHIPLVIAGPGVPAGTRTSEPVEIVDVTPTVLDLVGLKPAAGNQGMSLVPVMKGGNGKPVTIQQGMRNQIVRTSEAKYAVWATGEEVLFDLSKDPNELRNVAADPAARPLLDRMRLALLRRVIEIRDPLPVRTAPY